MLSAIELDLCLEVLGKVEAQRRARLRRIEVSTLNRRAHGVGSIYHQTASRLEARRRARVGECEEQAEKSE